MEQIHKLDIDKLKALLPYEKAKAEVWNHVLTILKEWTKQSGSIADVTRDYFSRVKDSTVYNINYVTNLGTQAINKIKEIGGDISDYLSKPPPTTATRKKQPHKYGR